MCGGGRSIWKSLSSFNFVVRLKLLFQKKSLKRGKYGCSQLSTLNNCNYDWSQCTVVA